MTKHIVLWNYADGFSPEENLQNAQKMKGLLEELPNLIDGIVELKVHINMMQSSNRDIMLDSLFESEEALAAYIGHPEHKRVGEFVRSVCLCGLFANCSRRKMPKCPGMYLPEE
jgi:vesicle coat complex subunit